jgi:response regulator RpfG family c-di-GMP phosphodiesterase
MSEKRGKVLYVDDEEINLINFRESLCDEFEIFTAISGEEALKLLEKEGEMALVVTDQRMPGIKGTDLLAMIREIMPRSERIIITGYTDPLDIIAAINEGHVYRYIVKPWNVDELRITMRQGVERYQLIQCNQELVAELHRKNLELEDKVTERTAELATTNQTLTARVEELERTKYELKTLRGLLAICSYCKKTRDSNNTWISIEEYLSRHADILLTHGICPDCYTQVMKDLPDQIKQILDKAS